MEDNTTIYYTGDNFDEYFSLLKFPDKENRDKAIKEKFVEVVNVLAELYKEHTLLQSDNQRSKEPLGKGE